MSAALVTSLLYLAPWLLLLVLLAFGHYPGERLLEAIARARRPVPRREDRPPARQFPLRSSPRGGALLALALAGRGPPA
ncbi:MAG TPA: hypothetical protein VFX85_04070 [Solirubrobacterales bacterium]|nr:hypothetical protein [Solirubrobacterales bacterium]